MVVGSPPTSRAQVDWRSVSTFWLGQRSDTGLPIVGLISWAALGPKSTDDHSNRVIADRATSHPSLLLWLTEPPTALC